MISDREPDGKRKWIDNDKQYRKREFEKRIKNYHKMIERDCYGCKKNKV